METRAKIITCTPNAAQPHIKRPLNSEFLDAQLMPQGMDEQQTCDNFIDAFTTLCHGNNLHFGISLLIEFFNQTPHQSACCFLKHSANAENFIESFNDRLAETPTEHLNDMVNLFEQTVLVAAETNINGLYTFLNDKGSNDLLCYASKSTNPDMLNFILTIFEKIQQLDPSFYVIQNIKNVQLLIAILNNNFFSLPQKRRASQAVLRRETPGIDPEILFFTGRLQRSPYTSKEQVSFYTIDQSIFSSLLTAHSDCINDFITFIRALPNQDAICAKLWGSTEPLAAACASANRDTLLPATISVYTLTSNFNGPSAFPLYELTISTQFRDNIIGAFKNAENDTKIILLAFLLANQSPAHIQEFLLSNANDGVLSQLITNDGMTPNALLSLPPKQWAKVLFDPLATNKYSITRVTQQLKTKRWGAKGTSLHQSLLPYLLLAFGMYFKKHSNVFTYSNRVNAFIAEVDIILGNTEAKTSYSFSRGSTFNRLYEILPKDKFSSSEEKEDACRFLFDFCNDEYTNTSDTTSRFHRLFIKPLRQRLCPLFEEEKILLNTKVVNETDSTLNEANADKLNGRELNIISRNPNANFSNKGNSQSAAQHQRNTSPRYGDL